MKALKDLRAMLCQELEEHARKGELSAGSLETVHKLTDTIKNIDKICMLEEGGGYSGGDGEWTARGNYSRDSYGRGSYGSYGGGYGEDGYSGAHYVRGHYSRDDGKGMINDRINEMLSRGDLNASDRNMLTRAMQIMNEH